MRPAEQKCIMLAADILGYELAHWYDEEMISHAAHRLVERHPIAARVAIISAGALLTAHLARVFDSAADPLSKDFRFRRRR